MVVHDLKWYPAYKDSGVPWLSKVPEHWEVRRIKRIALMNPAKSEARDTLSSDIRVTFLPMERVTADGQVDSRESRPVSALWTGFVYFRRADVLVAKITPCFENGKGACLDQLPTSIGFGSTEFHVLRASPLILPRYLYRLTMLPEFRRLGADAMTGAAGQQPVPQSFVENFPVGVPPLSEQLAIVRFLDYVDRRIRRYIRAKQKLIALLNEQKQAIIHRAVTRGLDPNVRFKPSALEWLGDVPEHWKPTRLKYAAKVQTGVTLGKVYGSVGLYARPYLRVANVQDGFLDLRDIAEVRVPASEAASCELQVGDVLMTEGGDIDKLGRGHIWRGEVPGCLHQNHIFAVRPNEAKLLPEYLAAIMTSIHGRSYFEITAKQTTNLASTNSTTLKTFPLFLPPIEEQRDLLDHIAEESSMTDAAILGSRNEIDRIREYRTRLIADAVTGKLDVRDAAVQLLDEPEQTVEIDEFEQAEDDSPRTAGLETASEEVDG